MECVVLYFGEYGRAGDDSERLVVTGATADVVKRLCHMNSYSDSAHLLINAIFLFNFASHGVEERSCDKFPSESKNIV